MGPNYAGRVSDRALPIGRLPDRIPVMTREKACIYRDSFDELEAEKGREVSHNELTDAHLDHQFVWEIGTHPGFWSASPTSSDPTCSFWDRTSSANTAPNRNSWPGTRIYATGAWSLSCPFRSGTPWTTATWKTAV